MKLAIHGYGKMGRTIESMAKERARYERALHKCLEIFKEEGIV